MSNEQFYDASVIYTDSGIGVRNPIIPNEPEKQEEPEEPKNQLKEELEDLKDTKQGSYLTSAEMERFHCANVLSEMAEIMIGSEDESNSQMGRLMLQMAEDVMQTLPEVPGQINFDVNVYNDRAPKETIDNIMSEFLGL